MLPYGLSQLQLFQTLPPSEIVDNMCKPSALLGKLEEFDDSGSTVKIPP
jgi:hypothetical protein